MRTTHRIALPLLAGGLLLAGCSGGGGTPAEPASPSPSAPPTEAAEQSSEPTEEPVEEGTEAATEDTAESAGRDCVEGTWELDLGTVGSMMAELVRAQGGDVDVEISGTALATFGADGAYQVEQEDLATVITLRAEGSEMVTTSVEGGTITGSWSVDGDSLTIGDLDRADATAQVTVTIDGETLKVPTGETGELPAGSAGEGTSTYECSADELRLTADLAAEGLDGLGLEDTDFSTVFHRR